MCSIPGHADGGMEGSVAVAGGFAEVPHSGSGQDAGHPSVEPDPDAPEYARMIPPRRRWPKV